MKKEFIVIAILVLFISACSSCKEEPNDLYGNIESRGTLKVKGTSEGKPWEDKCVDGFSVKLGEWTCNDNKPEKNEIDCSEYGFSVCDQGECKNLCSEEPKQVLNINSDVKGDLATKNEIRYLVSSSLWEVHEDRCSSKEILTQYYCDIETDSVISETINCVEQGYLGCNDGRCTNDVRIDFDNICLYWGDGSSCGNDCPIDHCENEYELGPDFDGIYRMITYPGGTDGKCIDEECVIGSCDPVYEKSSYCSNFQIDDDGDGLPNSMDDCPFTLSKESLLEYDSYGCPPDSLIPATCQEIPHEGGSGSHLNIIITPCGFDGDMENMFAYWIKFINAKLQNVEPFKSFPESYSYSYVWDLRKSYLKSLYTVDKEAGYLQFQKNCADLLQDTIDMSEEAGCNQENIVYIEIQHDGFHVIQDDSFKGVAYPSERYAYFSQGIPVICEQQGKICDYGDDALVGTALHEIGHLFKTGHPFGFKDEEDYYNLVRKGFWFIKKDSPYLEFDLKNDLYSPLYSFSNLEISEKNYYTNEPCPIWNFEDYYYWASLNNQEMGCYWGYNKGYSYDLHKYSYSPMVTFYSMVSENEFSVDSATLMTAEYHEPYKYNPITTKLIADALTYGYDKYLSFFYPYTCELIPESNYFREILAKNDVQLKELKEQCLINQCKYIKKDLILGDDQNAREFCCTEVEDRLDECLNIDTPEI